MAKKTNKPAETPKVDENPTAAVETPTEPGVTTSEAAAPETSTQEPDAPAVETEAAANDPSTAPASSAATDEAPTEAAVAEDVPPVDPKIAARREARDTLGRLMEHLEAGGDPPAGYMPRRPELRLTPEQAITLKRVSAFLELPADQAVGKLLDLIVASI